MKHARLSPRAVRDLDSIFRFIAGENIDAAENVRENILSVADFLAQYPNAGRRIRSASRRHANVRWLVVPKFRSYLIFYQPCQDTVMVIRVLHAAQDWKRFFPVG